MKKNDLKCPNCKVIISFKNVIAFEPDEMEIEAIAYFITCKKCETTFVSPMRYSVKASEEQEDVVKDMFEDIIKRRGNKDD